MGGAADDKRLDRLFEYTKFHIGIYLSSGGGLVVLVASADKSEFVKSVIGSPRALAMALILMIIAGLAGGVVASATTRNRSFDGVWLEAQGPFRRMKGRDWASLEHYSFWASVTLIAYSVLRAPAALRWLGF